MALLRNAFLALSHNRWLERQVKQRRFGQRAVRRFMPGEDVTDAYRAAEALGRHGIVTVLTQLGEDVTDRQEAEAVTRHYRDVLDGAAQRGLAAQISVKPTQLGLDVSPELCAEQTRALVRRAAERGNFVWIDMEGSAHLERTLDLYRALRAEHANVGVCLQAYLYRTPKDLEALLQLGVAIRLVKGAYREPATIAYARKRDVDAAYLELAQTLLAQTTAQRGTQPPGIATHDLELIGRVRRQAERLGVPQTAYEVQMLYGIRRRDQLRLAAEGHRVRVLISYGAAWFPWYMRRLAERPANVWFAVRSMVG